MDLQIKWNFYYRDNEGDWVNIKDYVLDMGNILDQRLDSLRVIVDDLAFPSFSIQEVGSEYRLQLYRDDFYFEAKEVKIEISRHLIHLKLIEKEEE